MFQNLKLALPTKLQVDSVHYLEIPIKDEVVCNPLIEQAIRRMQDVIEQGRNAREKGGISLRRPLRSLTIVHQNKAFLDDVQSLSSYVKEELNVRSIEFLTNFGDFIEYRAQPDRSLLGSRLKSKMGCVEEAIQKLTSDQVAQAQKDGWAMVCEEKIYANEMKIELQFRGDSKKFQTALSNGDVLLMLDIQIDQELCQEGIAREIVNRVQKLRKKAGLNAADLVEMFYRVVETKDQLQVRDAIQHKQHYIEAALKYPLHPLELKPSYAAVLISETVQVDDANVELIITCPTVIVNKKALAKTVASLSAPSSTIDDIEALLSSLDRAHVEQLIASTNGHYDVCLNGYDIRLLYKIHFFLSVQQFNANK